MNVNVEEARKILEGIRELGGPALKEWVEKLKKLGIKIANEYLTQLKDYVESILKAKDVKYEKIETLTLPDLKSLIKLYMVKGSDGVAAFIKRESDKSFLYLAFCKDRDFLPETENCYIIIEAQKLGKDVEELFAESDLIILN